MDDGLHTAEANKQTLKNLWGTLKPGGIHIIEDCVTYLNRLLSGIASLGKDGQLPNLRSVKVEVIPASEYGSVLVVLEKGSEGESRTAWSSIARGSDGLEQYREESRTAWRRVRGRERS